MLFLSVTPGGPSARSAHRLDMSGVGNARGSLQEAAQGRPPWPAEGRLGGHQPENGRAKTRVLTMPHCAWGEAPERPCKVHAAVRSLSRELRAPLCCCCFSSRSLSSGRIRQNLRHARNGPHCTQATEVDESDAAPTATRATHRRSHLWWPPPPSAGEATPTRSREDGEGGEKRELGTLRMSASVPVSARPDLARSGNAAGSATGRRASCTRAAQEQLPGPSPGVSGAHERHVSGARSQRLPQGRQIGTTTCGR